MMSYDQDDHYVVIIISARARGLPGKPSQFHFCPGTGQGPLSRDFHACVNKAGE